MSCHGWNVVNPICQVGSVIGGAAKSVGNDIFKSIAHYFADVAKDAVNWLWHQLNVATSIDLTAPNIKADLIATGSIAAVIAFALFLIQVITAALRQQAGDLGRAVRGLGVSFIGAAFAVASTQVLLAAVDELCNAVVNFALGTDVQGLGSKLIVGTVLSSIANPAGLLLISLILIAAVVVVWVALMIRKMLIIVSAVFAPMAFAGAAADISRSWVRRWIEFTVALVFSKLILVIIFMIGLSVLNGAGQETTSKATTSITDLVIGALTLMLAGCAPWIAIKMVHFAGDAIHIAHGQATSATAGARTVVAPPVKAAALVAQPMIWSRFSQRSVPSSPATGNGASRPTHMPVDQSRRDASSSTPTGAHASPANGRSEGGPRLDTSANQGTPDGGSPRAPETSRPEQPKSEP
jgi:hypothetical protein